MDESDLLGIIQIIFEVNFNHPEESLASQKGVRARLQVQSIFESTKVTQLFEIFSHVSFMGETYLMLGPNSLNFQSISNLLRSMYHELKLYLMLQIRTYLKAAF